MRSPWLATLLALAALSARAGEPSAMNAVRGIREAFDRYPVVAIGESHWIQQAGDFYVALVRDPAFQENVNDIVIEFAGRRSQSVVDRYVNGGDVPAGQLRRVWRDTTKVFSWESPIYPWLLAAVRDVNRGRPPRRRLRVLAGDSPIDWSRIREHEQWAATQPNNLSFAKVIRSEVLDRKRKALVILGSNHLTKGGDRDRNPDTTTLVEEKHPGSLYVVLLHDLKQAQEKTAGWPIPALVPASLPWLADMPIGKRKVGDSADAILYLGSSLTRAEPDWESYRADPDYLEELDRRARIEWGCRFDIGRFRRGLRACPEK